MTPNQLIETVLRVAKKIIPRSVFKKVQPFYHETLAFISAVIFRFPSRDIRVVAVTGTKGKTSVTEFINSIFEEAGYKTAVLNTIRFKVDTEERRNKFKMSTPGRGFVQRFLRKAVAKDCDWVIMEITSQAVLQARHKYIELDALVFTNISPEHIEAHGSFANYLDAKLEIARALRASSKEKRVIVANTDDEHGQDFINTAGTKSVEVKIGNAEPYELKDTGSSFTFRGVEIKTHFPGLFNIYNMLTAAEFACFHEISLGSIQRALEGQKDIRGRLELVNPDDSFEVYVDYAHTPDSLEKVYQAFPERRKVCILGNTGGGRDTWKRPVMARIAEKYCDSIILANEDPYDEDPQKIVDEMYEAIENKEKARIILDRREAIHTALKEAREGDVVLITGKGTDPYIMEAEGKKTPWDDASVVREEMEKIKKTSEEV
ncbi:MAG: UDP-N-acetylmuramoyl-L-alanyl-D-glutamate--2,6-diaminopimelate ligase [Candidatus Paceibacterota bacterium]